MQADYRQKACLKHPLYDTDSDNEMSNIVQPDTPDAALSPDLLLTPGSPSPTPVSGAEYEPPGNGEHN